MQDYNEKNIETKSNCDECGRFKKTHRNYKNKSFCAACYKRLFKAQKCKKCDNVARIYCRLKKPICSKCENNKPCIRCQKTNYAIGKITIYGPVCNSCSVYFRQAKACSLCGRVSKRLTKVSRLNINTPICQSCATKDYKSCQLCRRYRLLHKDKYGKMVCYKCADNKQAHCCNCNNLMPAGRGKICECCYWESTFYKRLSIAELALSSSNTREILHLFGIWLINQVGSHKAALTINKYLTFFIKINNNFEKIPTYTELATVSEPRELRKNTILMHWLKITYGISQDNEIKENITEEKTINDKLIFFPNNSIPYQIINSYYQYLMLRLQLGKIKIKSIRLALTPALGLLSKDLTSLPSQKNLNIYLSEKKGQLSAITGFIGFLNNSYHLQLTIDKVIIQKLYRKNLEKQLIKLIEQPTKDEAFVKQWFYTCLAYFHKLSSKLFNQIDFKESTFTDTPKGFNILLNNKLFWIPHWE